MEVLAAPMRHKVSQGKHRYKDDTFDLDLTYVVRVGRIRLRYRSRLPHS